MELTPRQLLLIIVAVAAVLYTLIGITMGQLTGREAFELLGSLLRVIAQAGLFI